MFNRTPLQIAAFYGSINMVKILLSKEQVNINSTDYVQIIIFYDILLSLLMEFKTNIFMQTLFI